MSAANATVEAPAAEPVHLALLRGVRNLKLKKPKLVRPSVVPRRAPAATTAAAKPPTTKVAVTTKPASDVMAGALARAGSQGFIHPLDTMKVKLQAGKQAAQAATSRVASKFSRLVPPKGVDLRPASLYKGVGGAATGAGIAIGAYFALYGAATNAIVRLTEGVDVNPGTIAFVAGAVAAAGSSFVKVPLAVCIRSVQAEVYPNVFNAARQIVNAAGVRGLFTGFLPTLLEDVPDMAVKFAAYETLRELHSRMNNGRKTTAHEDLFIGGFSGSMAAAATTPLDVVKTRMMTTASQRPTIISAAQSVMREGKGIKPFFSGVYPRSISNGINTAVFFCIFEALRAAYAKHRVADEKRAAQRAILREQRKAASLALAADEDDLWSLPTGSMQPVGASLSSTHQKARNRKA